MSPATTINTKNSQQLQVPDDDTPQRQRHSPSRAGVQSSNPTVIPPPQLVPTYAPYATRYPPRRTGSRLPERNTKASVLREEGN